MRGVTASKVSVTVALRLIVARAFHHPADLFNVTTGFLNSDQIRMLGKFNDQFCRHVVARRLWEVINDDGQRRSVGYHAIERQKILR